MRSFTSKVFNGRNSAAGGRKSDSKPSLSALQVARMKTALRMFSNKIDSEDESSGTEFEGGWETIKDDSISVRSSASKLKNAMSTKVLKRDVEDSGM